MNLEVFATGVMVQLLSSLHVTQPTLGMNPFSDLAERQFAAQRLEQCFCEVFIS